jgi:hypothetical protein
MSCHDIYRTVALEAIKQYNNLDILGYAWQSANFDQSWPSWIPKWDITINGVRFTPVLPFVYNTDQGIAPVQLHGADASSLLVQGLELDVVIECDTILDFEGFTVYAPGKCTEDILKTISLLLVHDKREMKRNEENSTERASSNLPAHFADFAAYLLMLLKDGEQNNTCISLSNIWCSVCSSRITPPGNIGSTPSLRYTCRLCEYGEHDLCVDCYNSGIRCHNSGHTIMEEAIPGLKFSDTNQIKEILKSYARVGDAARFVATSDLALKKRAFLYTLRMADSPVDVFLLSPVT